MRLPSPIKVCYAGPIDSRFSVSRYQDLAGLVDSGLVYAYMKVVVVEDGKTYQLQSDLETWVHYEVKGPKGDTGPKGDKGDQGPQGPALEVGKVELISGESADLEIGISPTSGKLDFKLTLPSYILGEEIQDLHTEDKTLIGAINEIYDMLS